MRLSLRLRAHLIVVVWITLSGVCRAVPTTFDCEAKEECTLNGVEGQCETTGFCSFGDSACESGHRYSSYATSDLANTCVPAAKVSAAFRATCALSHQQLMCWGNKAVRGLEGNTTRPEVIATSQPWEAIEVGEDSICTLREARAYCWGNNVDGETGQGHQIALSEPALVDLGADVANISLTRRHACAITANQQLFCWGKNTDGQLGRGTSSDFEAIPAPVMGERTWTQVATGYSHTCAIDADGALWCWGLNNLSQAGQPALDSDPLSIQLTTPTRVENGSNWQQLSLGQSSSCGIRADNSLWCWGEGGNAFGRSAKIFERPAQIDTAHWLKVSMSAFHTCGIRADDSLWCWGRNEEGQQGRQDQASVAEPLEVQSNEQWGDLDTGRLSTCALSLEGALFCTGNNSDGQLGLGDDRRRFSFTRVVLPN